jgi:(2R)-3-sulfolactate dehydrogenase (NADP+)
VDAEDVEPRLRALGFGDADARALADHFIDAEQRGKSGHGFSRVEWLATLDDLDPTAQPLREVAYPGFERWDGNGALGYLTLAAICDAQLLDPPAHARVVVARRTFPTGMLGYWVRRLADGGLVAALTAISPRRLGHPDGGPKLTGTNPLAIAIPSSDGRPIVSDVSMGRVTYGEVIAGVADQSDLVPFGGESAHKAFALAVGLELLVESLVGEGFGAVLVVARPEADPVPAFRELAGGVRLPGDS